VTLASSRALRCTQAPSLSLYYIHIYILIPVSGARCIELVRDAREFTRARSVARKLCGPLRRLLRQYSYICASKASQLSDAHEFARVRARSGYICGPLHRSPVCVSMRTFALVKQENRAPAHSIRLREYVYSCTSKASKASKASISVAARALFTRFRV
jgi:hypothetical protein